jgi:hypothetical protein
MEYMSRYSSYDLNFYRFLFKGKLQLNVMAGNSFQKNPVEREVVYGVSFTSVIRTISPYSSFQLTIYYRFGKLQTFNEFKKYQTAI